MTNETLDRDDPERDREPKQEQSAAHDMPRPDVTQDIHGNAHFYDKVTFNHHLTTPSNDPVEDLQVLAAEAEFRKWTGMTASAPARRYLVALLREDVTSAQIKRVWMRELTFSGNGLELKVPRSPWFLMTCIGISCALLMLPLILRFILFAYTPAVTAALFASVAFSIAGFFWGAGELLLPYRVSQRLVALVPKVNAGMASEGDDE